VRSVLADTNTGDADGDLGFFLDRRSLTARCALEPSNSRNSRSCRRQFSGSTRLRL
jgi:hypothetical protein